MKRICALLLTIIMALSIAGCGGSKMPAAPSQKVVKADVQEYVSELIDKYSVVEYVQIEDTSIEKNECAVQCIASYGNGEKSCTDEFIITYVIESGEWEISKCKINTDYAGKKEEQTSTVSNSVDETKKEAAEESKPIASETKPQANPANTQAMVSDNWQDFQFYLEGHYYTLPFTYREFSENGWSVAQSSYSKTTEESELAANSYESVKVTNGIVEIYVDIINLSGNVKAIKDCNVGSITVYAKNNLDFYTAKGISYKSTQDDITTAWGIPTSSNSYSDYSRLDYRVGDSYRNCISAYVCTKTSDNYIELKNFVKTANDETSVNPEVPAYLSEYVAPLYLDNDPTSTVFQLDGAFYQLPCPLSEFTKNGWTVAAKDVASVGGMNISTNALKITKNDNSLYLSVGNACNDARLVENCAVIGVDFDSYYLKNVADNYVVCSGWLTNSSTKSQVESVCAGFEKYEGSSSTSYTYTTTNSSYDTERRVKYYFSEYNGKTDLNISLYSIEWNY